MATTSEHWREGRKAWERLRRWFGDAPGSTPDGSGALDALSDVGRMRNLLDQAELAAVRTSRRRGSSWAEIAARLGVTRQSAWERWRDLDDAAPTLEASTQTPAGQPAQQEEAQPMDPAFVEELQAAAAAELINETRRRSTVAVPDVVGLSFAQAREALLDKRLVPMPSDPDGAPLVAQEWLSAVVTDQSPESGAKVPPGSRVTLWLARGGSAGVREPRRPSPSPRSLRAMRDERTGETLP
ncbi:PASTA domain-containing protein [Sinomonas terrae]|uniref:PASTA domain-containing protein n=1 Tax=Sinomonas terrae TaxID=2908838 RepID=A0ABS9U297_9MICC|nr:PASTA domain-containing protein [Sinomonas terrae]MCH6470818.1 PASTA domain-containing protein [Sinomonas terrae]